MAGQLEDGQFRVTGEYRVARPDGADLPATGHVIGRGSCLHVLDGQDWHRLTLGDIPPGSSTPAGDR